MHGRGYWDSWAAAARDYPRAATIARRYHQRPREQLYDLARDPNGQHNLAAIPAHAARLQSMRATLIAWMNEQGDGRTIFSKPARLENATSTSPEELKV